MPFGMGFSYIPILSARNFSKITQILFLDPWIHVKNGSEISPRLYNLWKLCGHNEVFSKIAPRLRLEISSFFFHLKIYIYIYIIEAGHPDHSNPRCRFSHWWKKIILRWEKEWSEWVDSWRILIAGWFENNYRIRYIQYFVFGMSKLKKKELVGQDKWLAVGKPVRIMRFKS